MKSRYEKASLGFILIIALLLFTLLEFRRQQLAPVPFSSEAQQSYVLNTDSLAASPDVTKTDSALFFDYRSQPRSELFTLKDDSSAGMVNFINNKPTYLSEQVFPDKPSNFTMIDSIDDTKESLLQSLGLTRESKHYYFNQTRCGGIPVYGAILQVDTKDGKDVVGISGRTITNEVNCSSEQSLQQMNNLAVAAFKKEQGVKEAQVIQGLDMLYNGQLAGAPEGQTVGGGNDPKTYLTKVIRVCLPQSVTGQTGTSSSCVDYFVDQSAGGQIIHRVDLELDAMNRTISAGSVVRREGQAATGNQGVDKAYDIMGQVYNYHFNTFQRDSADGRGLPIRVSITNCKPNASWNGQSITVCGADFVTNDILGHEFQHGITQFAVGGLNGLEYQYQSGALNESLSDVFGYMIDPDDWTMGEDTSFKGFRSMADPKLYKDPDMLSSSYYYCGSADAGGVHTNSGVFNKAFYLMVAGGTAGNSKGSCTITGITKEKAAPVVYRALTVYMKGKTTGNYCDMYVAMNRACEDLYQAGSAECAQVKSAMQAVEMDQQQTGKSTPPSCPFTNVAAPSCSAGATPSTTCTSGNTGGGGGGPVPTGPTNPPTTGSPLPTQIVTGSLTPVPTTLPTGGVTPQPTARPTLLPTLPPATPTPTPKQALKIILSSSASQGENLTGVVDVKPPSGGSGGGGTGGSDGQYTVSATINQIPEEFDQFSYEGRLLGRDKLSVGKFKKEGSTLTLSYSSAQDLLAYNGFEVVKVKNSTGGSTGGTEVTVLSGSSAPADTSKGVTLKLKLSFQKMATDNKLIQSLPVKVGIGGGTLANNLYTYTTFTSAAVQGCALTGRPDKHPSVAIYDSTWKAQTFTPPATGPLKKIRIWGYRDKAGQQGPTVHIRAVDSTGAPTGSDLDSARLDMTSGYADFGSKTTLVEGKQYAMVVSDETNNLAGGYWMYYINNSNCYYQQDSSSYTSTDRGSAWKKDVSDFFFTIQVDSPAWVGEVNFPDVQPGEGYKILVKGGKHVQKKVCQSRPQESAPGTYSCADGEIRLEAGVNELNFTGILQMAGDLPKQDGVVNSADLVQIRTRLNSTKPSDIEVADLNGDGVVNSIDYGMVVATLQNRSDGQ